MLHASVARMAACPVLNGDSLSFFCPLFSRLQCSGAAARGPMAEHRFIHCGIEGRDSAYRTLNSQERVRAREAIWSPLD